jgi:type I restriction enzyme, S subunit
MAPEDWTPTTLGDFVEIKHGFAFKGEYFRDEPPGDILLTPGNFAIGGGFKEAQFKYYDGPVPEDYVLQEGDLLVTMTDLSKQADTLGYSALVPKPHRGRHLHNQRLGKVEIQQGAPLTKEYLYFLLRTPAYRREVVAGASGTTVKHTSPGRIRAFVFLRPPVREQMAIARILLTLESKIELNRQMNRTLQAMADALFRAWFVDFEPVRSKVQGRTPAGLSDQVAGVFPDSYEDSQLGAIPRGWEIAPIGALVRVVGGSTPSTTEPAFWEGGRHYWATPKDLSDLQDPVLLDTERQITDVGLRQIGSGLLPAGTVLLSSRAPIGYLAISEVPVAVNQGFIAMVCNARVSNQYVLHWARVNMDTIRGRANGTTFQEISKANFRPIPILVPPEPVMEVFTRTMDRLHRRVVGNLLESRTLAELRDTLLPKLLSGEVRIADAGRDVGPRL